jgi:cytochrome c5
MRVVEQQERRDRKERKEKKEKKRTSSKRSAAASSDTSSDDEVLEITCKYCLKFSKSQHPTHITPDTCMWNKKVRKFRFNSVCRKMKLKFIEGGRFKTGEEDTWPKHKKMEKKED